MPQSCSRGRKNLKSRRSLSRTRKWRWREVRSARQPSLSVTKCFSARNSCARSRSLFRAADPVVVGLKAALAYRSIRSQTMQQRNATCAVIGAGDFIGAEIAKKFASEGFTVFAGRRDGAKLEPLVKDVQSAGGSIVARSLDARQEEEGAGVLHDADQRGPLEVRFSSLRAYDHLPK